MTPATSLARRVALQLGHVASLTLIPSGLWNEDLQPQIWQKTVFPVF
jgi:hypothetical protein